MTGEIPDAALHSWTNVPSEVAVRQIAQSEMTLPRKKNAWAKIVKAKIRGQASCLDSLGIEGEEPYVVSHPRSDPETPRITKDTRQENIGRGYLSVIANGSKGFQDGTGRNAQLDYAYTILRGFAVKAILSAGLIPTLGVNHHGRSNYFCLADDLLEVYRPAIDYWVAQLERKMVTR